MLVDWELARQSITDEVANALEDEWVRQSKEDWGKPMELNDENRTVGRLYTLAQVANMVRKFPNVSERAKRNGNQKRS